MKRIVRSLIGHMGYEFRRSRAPIPVRRTMAGSLAWLAANDFSVSTVLDVGASNGQWSQLCMSAYPNAHYVLFEPQPVHASALQEFVELNQPSVSVINKAVGGAVGTTQFDVSDPLGGALRLNASDAAVEVALTTIDVAVAGLPTEPPYLIKLDTHGFEKAILDGAHDTLAKSEVLVIEAYNYRIEPEALLFWELCAYLQDRGFRPIDMVDSLYRVHDGAFWQTDICFVKASWPGFGYISFR